ASLGDDVLVGSPENQLVHRLNGTTGAEIRRFLPPKPDADFGRAVAGDGDRVLVASDRRVYLFDAATGTLRASRRGTVAGVVVLDGGAVFIADTHGLDAYDAATLGRRRRYDGMLGPALAADAGHVLAVGPGCRLVRDAAGAYLVDRTTGRVDARFCNPSDEGEGPSAFAAARAILGDRFFLGRPGQYLTALY